MFVLHEFCVELDNVSERDAHRIACFESLSSNAQVCSSNGQCIPPPEAESILDASEQCVLHFNWMCVCSMESLRLDV